MRLCGTLLQTSYGDGMADLVRDYDSCANASHPRKAV
jgi:hypothetical protein